MKKWIVLLLISGCFISNQYANATSGRTNSSGCHNSKKVGYHCHGSPKKSTYKPKSTVSYSAPSKKIKDNAKPTSTPTFKSNVQSNRPMGFAGLYIVTANKLNIRDNPLAGNEIVGSFVKNQEVYVHSVVDSWAMVRCRNDFCWVSKNYLKKK
jgi:hypothetical protein